MVVSTPSGAAAELVLLAVLDVAVEVEGLLLSKEAWTRCMASGCCGLGWTTVLAGSDAGVLLATTGGSEGAMSGGGDGDDAGGAAGGLMVAGVEREGGGACWDSASMSTRSYRECLLKGFSSSMNSNL